MTAVPFDGGVSAEPFAGLEPVAVWRHFAALCRIPRPSKGEGPVREAIRSWAVARGLEAEVDAAGNLLVRKAAAPGCADWPTTVLQSHLDMVCQSNADAGHDWQRDALVPVLRDGWLVAEKTTLGADNGLGVALMLAVLADKTLRHGPLEALFTVDEEAGMGGARGLRPDWLQGRRMLNLDTEEWGEFYLGCAGGCDVLLNERLVGEACPAGLRGLRLRVHGLRGGHSGVDIHEGRGNALKLLVRCLNALAEFLPFRLQMLCGGTARNAIAREAEACVAVDAAAEAKIREWLATQEAEWRESLAGIDEGVCFSLERLPEPPLQVLSEQDQMRWLALLDAAPHGVAAMSQRVPGVVDTSNNLGIVHLEAGHGEAALMVRSLRPAGTRMLAGQICSLARLAGITPTVSGEYPGWTPNPDSPLLALCQRVYARDFGAESAVRVIHAGLECGLIGACYPGMDTVSFGPTIRGAHAPGEAVEVASVGKVWALLTAILAEPSL